MKLIKSSLSKRLVKLIQISWNTADESEKKYFGELHCVSEKCSPFFVITRLSVDDFNIFSHNAAEKLQSPNDIFLSYNIDVVRSWILQNRTREILYDFKFDAKKNQELRSNKTWKKPNICYA